MQSPPCTHALQSESERRCSPLSVLGWSPVGENHAAPLASGAENSGYAKTPDDNDDAAPRAAPQAVRLGEAPAAAALDALPR